MICRFCHNKSLKSFVDLGFAPPSNSFLRKEELYKSEIYLPLKVVVCPNCYLVQTIDFTGGKDIFTDEYVYYSSYSSTLLKHSKKYVDKVIKKFCLNSNSLIIEVASNDGYLLQYFKEYNIPILGIEPTKGTANKAINNNIETIIDFLMPPLARQLADKGIKADLIIGNNVLAHNEKLNDFIEAQKLILKDDGVITMEFPHLVSTVSKKMFDTIYHEHFSYFSFISIEKVYRKHNLVIFDVEEIATHGGSLRIYVKHLNDKSKAVTIRVKNIKEKEKMEGVETMDYYSEFQTTVNKIKNEFLQFLLSVKKSGKKIMGYGAAAKASTLLNFAGVRCDLLPMIADISPYKQGKFIPGCHIPVVGFEKIKEYKPDFLLIFPWNLIEEISAQHSYIKSWEGKFVTAIPEIKII